MAIDVGAAQDQGARDYQEDVIRLEVTGAGVLAIVCDGMGGHEGGALASATAAEAIAFHILAALENRQDSEVALAASIEAANKAIAGKIEDGAPPGMGTTALAVWATAESVHWVSVGDSPLFRVERSVVQRLNADHSMAPVLDEMAAIGRITAEEARTDPRRNALRSALSGDEIGMVDQGILRRPFVNGCLLLLGSDGLETLARKDILRIARRRSRRRASDISAALISEVLSKKAPHQDNVSVITLRMRKESFREYLGP